MAKVGYGRVSTNDQRPRAQLDALIEAGCDPELRFIDNGVSGVKAHRPELDRMLSVLRKGDVVVITRLDRLGRSVQNLVELVERFRQMGVELVVLTQGIDTTTPAGKMLFHMVAAIAEFEHDLISERTREGLKAAKARGKLGGRKPSYSVHQAQTARDLHAKGELTAEEIGRVIGVSRATVFRMVKDERPAPAKRTVAGTHNAR
jgi:DNA invertase Pin-like site-specific DNA recombinase